MGIKFASGRHANVVVMAPALTETAQTQSFKFVTSPSRSPSLSLKNHLKKKLQIISEEVEPKLSNGLKTFTGMNGHSPVSKTTYSINGLAKNLKNEFLPLNQKKEDSDEKRKLDANYSITQIGGYIMNSGFMGDPDMGLQKSNKDICEGEKISPEVDQMLKNLVSMNNEELGSNPELNQNVEEIFKAISTLDTNTNEIESGPSGDNMFPDMSAALSFERGLFNDVDIMNMCVDETLVTVNKETLVRDRIEYIRKMKFQLGRKFDFLKRRIRKIKARTIGKHLAEEITGVIEYSSNLLEASSRLRGFPSSDIDSDIKCDVKSVSFSTMSHFMRQIEHAVHQQTNTVARNSIRQCKYFGSGSSSNNLISTSNGVRSSLPGSVLPTYPTTIKRELTNIVGELLPQAIEVQEEVDSDATESSSGCESCDEFISYNNTYQHQLSISKRANWKWAEERALIAAKWTWLQSQMADLEYKIRQQSDAKRNVRTAKGAIKFQAEQVSSPNLPNGCNNSEKGESSCSRTRGLVRSSFGKRKLLQVNGLHRTSKKAARSASLRCSCSSSLPGCGLCTGRSEPGQPQEPLSTLPVSQRVGYLDPGFHPVLSFPQDVCTSIHYNAVMKCTDWQSRASRIQGKALIPNEEKTRGRPPSNDHQVVDLQRSKAAALAVSVKLRRKLARGKRRRRTPNLTLDRYRHRRKHSAGLSGADSEETVEQDIDTGGGSRYPSPVPSPASTHAPTVSKDKDVSIKRKRENSYDIDNIVIPYSMASSTRLEKLNYKEIPTPKWRIISKKDSFEDLEQRNGIIRRSSHENTEMEEDNSDEAAIARHERCQIDEKKRFLSYLKLPGGLSRGRAQRRTDSRADSSGPNTPDGMSPRDDGSTTLEENSVITSPPQSACDNDTGRRRTVSGSQIPPVISEVDPYEQRKFPLTEEAFRKLREGDDHYHHPPNNSSYQNSAGPISPGSVSTDSADSFIGEDPNDPEWTTHATVDRTNSKR